MRLVSTLLAGSLLALAGCGSPPASDTASEAAPEVTTATSEPGATPPAADGRPAAYAQCAACHSTEKGKHGVGPSLAGVYGTKSGEVADFAFSEAMKKANLTWDEATLDKYLQAPMKLVPGTRMTYAGMADPARRKELIEYLKTLK